MLSQTKLLSCSVIIVQKCVKIGNESKNNRDRDICRAKITPKNKIKAACAVNKSFVRAIKHPHNNKCNLCDDDGYGPTLLFLVSSKVRLINESRAYLLFCEKLNYYKSFWVLNSTLIITHYHSNHNDRSVNQCQDVCELQYACVVSM